MSADAIVVLGCRVRPDGTPGAFLLERVRVGVGLLGEHEAARLVLSGGRRWSGVAECDAMKTAATELGAEPTRILCERRSMSTVGNALETRRLLEPDARVVLVTQAFHAPRALRLFRSAGLRTECVTAPTPPSTGWVRMRLHLGEQIANTLDRLWTP